MLGEPINSLDGPSIIIRRKYRVVEMKSPAPGFQGGARFIFRIKH